jgi:hypothetical protein
MSLLYRMQYSHDSDAYGSYLAPLTISPAAETDYALEMAI